MKRESSAGVTLIELIVVLVILSIAFGILYEGFIKVFKTYKEQAKLEESNIEKLIALEILRKDIELAGIGIPSDLNGNTYNEISSSICSLCDDSGNPPRPICVCNDSGPNNSDHLVIKSSMALITNTAARKIAFLFPNSIGEWNIKYTSQEGVFDNNTDYFIILDPNNKTLEAVNGYWFLKVTDIYPLIDNDNSTTASFTGSPNNVYALYGILNSSYDASSLIYKKPFNRVDYYLDSTSKPVRCHPDTYELYRSNISHLNGSEINKRSILDCVLDFQLAFGLDTDNDTKIDTWSLDISSLNSTQITEQLKQVRVYIVYQMGRKNSKKVFRDSTITITAPDGSIVKTIDMTPYTNYEYYQWKLISFGVTPFDFKPLERF